MHVNQFRILDLLRHMDFKLVLSQKTYSIHAHVHKFDRLHLSSFHTLRDTM